ncbi:MAG: GNAT family N-acetyltransferase [Beutenbergiaceae bacterium]
MTSDDQAGYPAHWEADVVLRDGSTMHIRPIRPDDANALQTFHTGQSEQSIYFRFFAPLERLSPRELTRFTTVDHDQRVALVLVQPDTDGERIIAVGRFDRIDDEGESAEVAFNVADAAQGRGLGSILLEHLAAAGRELGVRRFVADVLPSNTRMIRVFTDAGYDVVQRYADGVLEVSVPIRPTDRSLEVLAERERRAEAVSMAALLGATGVVAYHSGDEGDAVMRPVLASIAAGDFTGVSVAAQSLEELAAHSELPTLALVAAPAPQLPELAALLAQRGVRVVVLFSGGYSDRASESATSQHGLVRLMRRHGLRLVGPRSYGVLAQGLSGRIAATLAVKPMVGGDIGVFGQSSGASRVLLEGVSQRRLGLSSFLSAGLRADISGNDTMQYWSQDEATKVACLYLESIGNPRKFTRVARGLARIKPVVATIAGTIGQQRLPGHAVRVSNAPRRVLEQLMRQAGVLLAGSVRQQLDWAMLLATQPLPVGDRVLIVSNSGSQSSVIGDLVRDRGLRPADEPLVLPATVNSAELDAAIGGAIARQDWDMAVIAYGPFGVDIGAQVTAQAISLAATGRAVAALIPGLAGLAPELRGTDGEGRLLQVPAYAEAADAVGSLAAAHRYHQHTQQRASTRVEPAGIDRRSARQLTRAELLGVAVGTSVRLGPERAAELLAAYGITVWPAVKVGDLDEALAAAQRFGWPVALKASDELLRHRPDLGGVRLDLSTVGELSQAFTSVTDLMQRLGHQHPGLEVQAMAPSGASCVITGIEDELYGPLISFGLAGDATELLDDVAYRIPPLTDSDVRGLVREVRAAPRLLGYRGLPALDVGAVEDLIARVSALKEDLPEVKSVILKPVIVADDGAAVVSASVDLAPAERGDMARRTLP